MDEFTPKKYRDALKRANKELKKIQKTWIGFRDNKDGTITIDDEQTRAKKFQLENVINYCKEKLGIN